MTFKEIFLVPAIRVGGRKLSFEILGKRELKKHPQELIFEMESGFLISSYHEEHFQIRTP
jgi:hypothetical protein